MQPTHFAFVDEYGDANLQTELSGVSTHFIISAVLLPSEGVDEARLAAEAVRRRHFQTGEMKSKGVGADDDRRLRLWKDLAEVPFRYYSFIVDKRRLELTGGLIYKQSFLKFLNGLVYRRLFNVFWSLSITADEHGSKLFMDGFIRYVERQHVPDLFHGSTFNVAPSNSDPLIQLADMVSGTLARFFDPKRLSSKRQHLLREALGKAILIEEWPPRIRTFQPDIVLDRSHNLDELVRELSYRRAIEFLEAHASDTEEPRCQQVQTLQYLFYRSQYVDPQAYVPTQDLISLIQETTSAPIRVHYFRSNVIAKLRDQHVIIGSSNRGYKLPVTVADLHTFALQVASVVGPILSRLGNARDQLLLATTGQFDLLDHDELRYLKGILDDLRLPAA
jgi:hypothetical protein